MMQVTLMWVDETLVVFDYKRQVPSQVTVRTVIVKEKLLNPGPFKDQIERCVLSKWNYSEDRISRE